MIRVISDQARYAPVFVCDQCKERITDSGMAIAVYRDLDKGSDQSEVWHLHKGKCDKAFQVATGQKFPWQELRDHLLFLSVNVGFSPQEMAAREHQRRESGMANLP